MEKILNITTELQKHILLNALSDYKYTYTKSTGESDDTVSKEISKLKIAVMSMDLNQEVK